MADQDDFVSLVVWGPLEVIAVDDKNHKRYFFSPEKSGEEFLREWKSWIQEQEESFLKYLENFASEVYRDDGKIPSSVLNTAISLYENLLRDPYIKVRFNDKAWDLEYKIISNSKFRLIIYGASQDPWVSEVEEDQAYQALLDLDLSLESIFTGINTSTHESGWIVSKKDPVQIHKDYFMSDDFGQVVDYLVRLGLEKLIPDMEGGEVKESNIRKVLSGLKESSHVNEVDLLDLKPSGYFDSATKILRHLKENVDPIREQLEEGKFDEAVNTKTISILEKVSPIIESGPDDDNMLCFLLRFPFEPKTTSKLESIISAKAKQLGLEEEVGVYNSSFSDVTFKSDGGIGVLMADIEYDSKLASALMKDPSFAKEIVNQSKGISGMWIEMSTRSSNFSNFEVVGNKVNVACGVDVRDTPQEKLLRKHFEEALNSILGQEVKFSKFTRNSNAKASDAGYIFSFII